jgi:DNA repair exonuclease SbcCD ATPase subunit
VRKRGPDSLENEKRALIEQRETLAALQRQLAERVGAVRAREIELRDAVAKARPGSTTLQHDSNSELRPPEPRSALPPLTTTGGSELEARIRALDERERAVATREEALASATARLAGPDDDTDENVLADQRRLTDLEGRERTLTRELAAAAERERALTAELTLLREAAAGRPELPPTQEEQDASRVAEIAARLAELRAAEKAFERTRDELTARSEAVAARERLVGEREREVAEQADGWGANPELHELESRLRRLEHQKGAPQPAGFSSGIRKLEQQGNRGKQTS